MEQNEFVQFALGYNTMKLLDRILVKFCAGRVRQLGGIGPVITNHTTTACSSVNVLFDHCADIVSDRYPFAPLKIDIYDVTRGRSSIGPYGATTFSIGYNSITICAWCATVGSIDIRYTAPISLMVKRNLVQPVTSETVCSSHGTHHKVFSLHDPQSVNSISNYILELVGWMLEDARKDD